MGTIGFITLFFHMKYVKFHIEYAILMQSIGFSGSIGNHGVHMSYELIFLKNEGISQTVLKNVKSLEEEDIPLDVIF